MKLLALSALLLLPAARAADAPGPLIKEPGTIDWKASGSLPPGAEYHLMYEDSKTHAVQTLVRFPRGYTLPPHSHSADELMLVLKGRLVLGFGERKETVGPGGYALIPAGTVFTLKAEGFGGVEFMASFNGPFDMKLPAAAKP